MMNHAHLDAALLAIVMSGLVWLVDWIFELGAPPILFVFIGFYLVLYVIFSYLWRR